MSALFASTDPQHITCGTSELSAFTKQFAVLMGAGIPMHEALDTLSSLQSDRLSLWVIPDLANKIAHGHRLSTALGRFPRVFPKTYVALIRGSEETGEIIGVLHRLGNWLERQDSIERQVKKALTYPVFVVALVSILTVALFRTVIPGILETVIDLGADLPAPTKLLMAVVDMLGHPLFWVIAVASVIGSVVYLRSPNGRENFLLACHYTPVLGGILSFSGSSRYSLTLSMLLGTGVDVIRAVRISGDASGNPLLAKDSVRVAAGLREGRYLSDCLEAYPVYPPLLVDMIKVGDETGRMAELLEKCAALLEEDTMHRLTMLTDLLEPVVMAVVATLVGAVLIAILLPMSNLISAL